MTIPKEIPKDIPRNRVGARTLHAVRYELETSRRPLSIPELSRRLDKSYHTIKAALLELEAVDLGGYPKLWEIPADKAELRTLGNSPEVVMVPYQHIDGPVGRWNKARKQFATNLSEIEVTPETDPRELAKQLTVAATTLASLAYAIELAHGPDWFDKLGGKR